MFMNIGDEFSNEMERATRPDSSREQQHATGHQQEGNKPNPAQSFWDKVYSKEGLALNRATLIPVIGRLAIAGLVHSMAKSGIDPNRYVRSTVMAGSGPYDALRHILTRQTVEGWSVETQEGEYSSSGKDVRTTEDLYISTDFQLYAPVRKRNPTESSLNTWIIDESVITASVTKTLRSANVPWVKPPEHYWKG